MPVCLADEIGAAQKARVLCVMQSQARIPMRACP